jgi:hypothetical protein
MRAFGIIILLFAGVFAHASPVAPCDISQQVFQCNKYEADDLAYLRFNQKREWGPKVRVNIGPGENFHLGQKKFALYENRYFFLNSSREQLRQNLDVAKIFSNRKDIVFNRYVTNPNGKSEFEMVVDKSGMFATVVVRCFGTAETGPLTQTTNSDFYRFQMRLLRCDINGRTTLLENGWITLDAFQFDNVSNKSGLVLRSLHFNEAKKIEGHDFNERQVSELVLGVEDDLILSLLGKLGYKVQKAFLWRHQL